MSPPVVIRFHNRFFEEWPDPPAGCAPGVRFTTETDDGDGDADADAVVFHIPTLGRARPLPEKPEGQLWVAWSLESRVMCPPLDDPAFMSRFDITMTYERSSDVWFPYFGPGTVPGLRQPAAPPTARTPVVWLQANAHDRCGRSAFAAELMRRVQVDSFGSVLRNQEAVIPPGHEPRMDLYRRYKLTLAFENSFATDYVTEKIYEPLAAGSVPVYRGAAEVADLVPSPDCYIDARRFASATELGAYLDHLDRNDDEYLEYHRWRSEPWSPTFVAHLELLRDPPLRRLAEMVADHVARRGRRSCR